MGEPTKEPPLGPRSRWVWLAAGAGLSSIAFYTWVGWHEAGVKVEWWGQLADSVGLFGTLFNAGALAAALWAVHLQRQESHESGETTKKQLTMMGEQLAALAQSAKAQDELAAVQAVLAKHQIRANQLAAGSLVGQYTSITAALTAAAANVQTERDKLTAASGQATAAAKSMDTTIRLLTELQNACATERANIIESIAPGVFPKKAEDGGGTNA